MARGSIEQRSPGTWSIRIEITPDPTTGKRRQKRATFRGTRREAEKHLSEMLHQLDTGNYLNPGKMTVREFLRQWLRDYVEAGVRATTREGYRIIAEKHLIPGMGNLTLSQLQPSHLQTYYAKALKEGRSDGKGGLSPRTVKHHHRVLSEALNHAMRWGLVSRNVALAVDPPRPVNKEMHILDSAGIRLLLEAAQGTLYYPAIHLAVFSGMRRSEVLGLRWRDLDMVGSALTVNQVLHVLPGGKVIFQEPKTDRSRRTITLGPSAVLALKAHRERVESDRALLGNPIGEDDLVFANPTGTPMLPNTLTHAFGKIARKAGLNVRLHDMRHSHVSMLIKQGIHDKAIADRVGHSSISTTMDIYGHLFSETQREAAIKFELGLVIPTPEEVKLAP